MPSGEVPEVRKLPLAAIVGARHVRRPRSRSEQAGPSTARSVLGDSALSPRYIETVAGRDALYLEAGVAIKTTPRGLRAMCVVLVNAWSLTMLSWRLFLSPGGLHRKFQIHPVSAPSEKCETDCHTLQGRSLRLRKFLANCAIVRPFLAANWQ